MRTRTPLALGALLLLLAGVSAPAPARAEDGDGGFRGWGPRMGLTLDPDQFHFGLHADFGTYGRRVRFQPNAELGLGDHRTLLALNFEAAYRFSSRWDVWTPYVGGGPGMNFVSADDGLGDGTSTDFGMSIIGGIERGLSGGDRFFTEFKLGLIDAPDAKFTVGWTFYD